MLELQNEVILHIKNLPNLSSSQKNDGEEGDVETFGYLVIVILRQLPGPKNLLRSARCFRHMHAVESCWYLGTWGKLFDYKAQLRDLKSETRT